MMPFAAFRFARKRYLAGKARCCHVQVWSAAVIARCLTPVAVAVIILVAASSRESVADTLEAALALTYQNNPQLNAQRAATRATDEGVGVALSGYRPRVTATGQTGEQYLDTLSKGNSKSTGATSTSSYGLTTTQTLFNGFGTASRTRQAEAQVLAARETLRLTQQTVLLSAVTAYMNLLRDTAIVQVQRSNVSVLQATLRLTQDRYNAGEVTPTDVAQSESRLASGRSQLLQAESNYTTSKATYEQVVGVKPGKLAAAKPVDRLSPPELAGALARAAIENPAITIAGYNVDTAVEQVKIGEAALYPTVSVNGSMQKSYGSATNLTTLETLSGSVIGQIQVPIYQGGAEYATIRQAKETLGQRRIDLDTARLQVQSTVVQSWGQLLAAKAQVDSTQAQIEGAVIALDGVREEARVGQRTTLDVLNAQQDLVNARVAGVTAEHDRVVASFALLASVGRLSPQALGLNTPTYDPMTHYQQVRDVWIGVRTPDGR
jgi:outer membrane protein